MENPEFLHKKYRDLNTSPEVESAAQQAKRREDKELPPQKPGARIQNYLDRLATVLNPPRHEHAPEFDTKKRNLEFLKQSLYKEFVVKPDEIPESYFASIKRKYREQGHGDITIAPETMQSIVDAAIADQKRSLDRWINYLISPDAKYPDYLKYYAMRSVLGMSTYDRGSNSFAKRSNPEKTKKGTVALFPELNREALAIVLNALERKHLGKQQKLGYDLLDIKQQFMKLLEDMQKDNFAELYALAIEKFKPIPDELLRITEGRWKHYPLGSAPKPLVASLENYGTGWCLRGEDTTKRYLQGDKTTPGNDLYIFYSNDLQGTPSVPRAVMVVNKQGQILEVRGVAIDENLDQYLGDIVAKKLQEFPSGTTFEKQSRDMKQLTGIDKKSKAGQALNKNDLAFLYELDTHIEGFGYEERDPRIAELRTGRNTEADMLVIFDCAREQIAHTSREINENTKAYVGKLEPGIFELTQQYNIDHIYTSFPERKIRKEKITIGGKTEQQLEEEMRGKSVNFEYVRFMMQSKDFTTLEQAETGDYVRLHVSDLLPGNPTTDQLYARAGELGLDLCPAETGPHYRLQHLDQPVDEVTYIAMKQIAVRGGRPDVFHVDRFDGGLWLSDGWGGHDHGWLPDDEFLFRLRK